MIVKLDSFFGEFISLIYEDAISSILPATLDSRSGRCRLARSPFSSYFRSFAYFLQTKRKYIEISSDSSDSQSRTSRAQERNDASRDLTREVESCTASTVSPRQPDVGKCQRE